MQEHNIATTFLWIAIILLAAKSSSIVERFGQPSVLGELVTGAILGNLTLLGIQFFEPIKSDGVIAFLAELGVVILLFQIGLESNIEAMRQVGLRAFSVACIGVVLPFIFGTYVFGPWLLPGLSFDSYLFLGATLTATSVGITAKVFRDLGKLQDPEAQIVLGAAVIDDVLGLIILAVVSAVVTSGPVSLDMAGWIVVKALIFLVGAVILGQPLALVLGRLFSTIHAGTGMKFTLAISFGLILAYFAQEVGLAPIVGAFAAGLVLKPVHFRYFQNPRIVDDIRRDIKDAEPQLKERMSELTAHYAHRHIEDIIEPIGFFLVPIFFVMVGMAFRLEMLLDFPLMLVALGITVAAVTGKVLSGLVAGKVRKLVVGWGMVPRGEVGLIFAAIGKSLSVVTDEVFSVIVIVVILTTFVTPPILTFLLRRHNSFNNTTTLRQA